MPRFIVIESLTGKVYGDTARLGSPPPAVASAADAACLIDRAKGRAGRGFGFVGKGSPNASLDVYRVPDSEEPTPDERAALALVERRGEYVTSLITYNS